VERVGVYALNANTLRIPAEHGTRNIHLLDSSATVAHDVTWGHSVSADQFVQHDQNGDATDVSDTREIEPPRLVRNAEALRFDFSTGGRPASTKLMDEVRDRRRRKLELPEHAAESLAHQRNALLQRVAGILDSVMAAARKAP